MAGTSFKAIYTSPNAVRIVMKTRGGKLYNYTNVPEVQAWLIFLAWDKNTIPTIMMNILSMQSP